MSLTRGDIALIACAGWGIDVPPTTVERYRAHRAQLVPGARVWFETARAELITGTLIAVNRDEAFIRADGQTTGAHWSVPVLALVPGSPVPGRGTAAASCGAAATRPRGGSADAAARSIPLGAWLPGRFAILDPDTGRTVTVAVGVEGRAACTTCNLEHDPDDAAPPCRHIAAVRADQANPERRALERAVAAFLADEAWRADDRRRAQTLPKVMRHVHDGLIAAAHRDQVTARAPASIDQAIATFADPSEGNP